MATVRRLGQYRLVRKLGQGGMGTVFEAIQDGLDRKVALKILPTTMRDASLVERFKREARAVARLNHPNIVTIYEVGEDQGLHFFSMELIDGQNLRELLDKNGPLKAEDAVELLRQAIDGLAHAWQAGIIHRDIKPDNLMVAKNGTLKIADLGLAKTREAMNTLTHSGVAMGTPYYMSPQQGYDAKNVDSRTDIYSLGATFYHLLAGRVPFEGSSPIEVAIKISTAPLEPIRKMRAEIPTDLATVIEKMLAREVEDRYQNATELSEALRVLDGSDLPPELAPLQAALPSLIKKIERSDVAGLMLDELELLRANLLTVPSAQARRIFREAGQLLGQRGQQSGSDRGLSALISVYIEFDRFDLAHDVGMEVVQELPESFEARHFTAVGALHRRALENTERERYLFEVLDLESQAQQLRSNYGPSISTEAQAHHELWRHFRSLGQLEKAESHIQQAISAYERRLTVGASAFSLALYAGVLRDAGQIQEALVQAKKACEMEWFLREAQKLILALVDERAAIIPETEEHFRRWSRVAGEWPETVERANALSSYVNYLKRNKIWPELLLRQQEQGRQSAEIHINCDRAARPPREATFQRASRRIGCTLKVWEFDDLGPSFIVGVPAIKLFGRGTDFEKAESSFADLIFMLGEKLRGGRWRKSPELTMVDRWMAEHLY